MHWHALALMNRWETLFLRKFSTSTPLNKNTEKTQHAVKSTEHLELSQQATQAQDFAGFHHNEISAKIDSVSFLRIFSYKAPQTEKDPKNNCYANAF